MLDITPTFILAMEDVCCWERGHLHDYSEASLSCYGQDEFSDSFRIQALMIAFTTSRAAHDSLRDAPLPCHQVKQLKEHKQPRDKDHACDDNHPIPELTFGFSQR